jgi:uncharacterized protein (TIGR01569 family)
MYNVAKQGGSGSKLVTLLLLALRTLTFVFGLIGLAILAADKTTSDFQFEGTDYQVDLKFSIFAAYKFMVAACAIVCFYSLCQVIHTCVMLCIGSSSSSNILLAWFTFICDQCLAYFVMAAGAAGAAVAMLTRSEESCSDLGVNTFCVKAEVSVSMAFCAFLFLAITAAFTARRLFRLF